MSKMTLLEIVQDVMNDMTSDQVNSISDTEESIQIAQIAKTTYFEMIGRRDWPHLSKFTTLSSVSLLAQPTHLLVPANVSRLDWFKYNKKRVAETRNRFEDVEYLHPDEFINKLNARNLDDTNVISIADFGGATLQIIDDKQPTYFTSFDDKYIVLDSYDTAIESSVQGSNTQIKAYTIPTWSAVDGFTPDLPTEHFPGYLAEVKSIAKYRLEGEADQKAEQQSERQQKRLSVNNWTVHGGIRYPDYGRRVNRTASSSLFGRS